MTTKDIKTNNEELSYAINIQFLLCDVDNNDTFNFNNLLSKRGKLTKEEIDKIVYFVYNTLLFEKRSHAWKNRSMLSINLINKYFKEHWNKIDELLKKGVDLEFGIPIEIKDEYSDMWNFNGVFTMRIAKYKLQ